MLRLWRGIEGKAPALNAKVQKSSVVSVNIPLPTVGAAAPLIRLNALPIIGTPRKYLSLSLRKSLTWDDVREIKSASEQRVLLAKGQTVFGWGERSIIKDSLGTDLLAAETTEVPSELNTAQNLNLKGLLEEALCVAASRNRPLLARTICSGSYLVADPHADDHRALSPLFSVVGKQFGTVPGLFTSISDEHPHPEKVSWAEAARISLDIRADKAWMLIDPEVWIWPTRARRDAEEFLGRRKGGRYNNVYNQLLDAWIKIIFAGAMPNTEIELSAFDFGAEEENPRFVIGTRTAYSRRGAQ